MRFKYPRTPHLPFSEGKTDDDKVLSSMDHFNDKEVVIILKLDGENSTILSDGFYARSLDSKMHPSRTWLAKWHASIAHEIPYGWRICGENMYAQHSIPYDDLPSYFLGFSIWNNDNNALSWNDTLEYFQLLGIIPVTTIYQGIFNIDLIKELCYNLDVVKHEGIVIRLASSFHYTNFSKSVAKWVCKNHVKTDSHWIHSKIIPNKLI